ncbi:MAG: outer membrane beta-barrel protein, partial [Patescibacteria group bacterium]|nr:outer membrane beta-barrel protein [Patescibacteria group bacterium]
EIMKLADTALLERRQWISQLAAQRGCTIDQARAYEQSSQHWAKVLRWLAIGILLTFLSVPCALPAQAEDGLYLYGTIGQSRFNQAGTDGNWRQEAVGVRKRIEDLAWSAGLGYRFNPYFAVEAGYLDFGVMQSGGGVVDDRAYHPSNHTYDHRWPVAQFDAQDALQAGTLKGKVSYPLGPLSPFLTAGVWGGPHQLTWINSNRPHYVESFHGMLIGVSAGGGLCYGWVCGQVEYYRSMSQSGFPMTSAIVMPSVTLNVPFSILATVIP